MKRMSLLGSMPDRRSNSNCAHGLRTSVARMGAIQWLSFTALLYMAASCAWHWAHVQYQQPACEMTYMYPSFNRIHSPTLDKENHRYVLYEYRDGIHQPGPTDFTTPALFIPGNAGNYKQVRSIASETTRVWAAQKTKYPDVPVRRVMIQWFAVDTREEMSAFDGTILERQAAFTLLAIRYLMHRYNITSSSHQEQQADHGNAGSRPAVHPGILLVGHSMGGVVAHAAWLDATNTPDLGPSAIAMLFTLASPLQRPPLPAHPSLARFYASRTGKSQPWAPLISLSGGWNDTQVAHTLTSPVGIHPRHLTLHVTTMAVPGAWLSPSHNVIVWCNQLMKPLSQFLTQTAWKLHYEPAALMMPDDLNAANAKLSEAAVHDQAGGLDATIQRPDRTTMILETATAHLLPRAAVGLPMPDAQTTATATHNKYWQQADDFASLPSCSGPNLAWYLQYIKPKQVKPKRHSKKQCSSNSSSDVGDIPTAVLSLNPTTNTAVKEPGQGRLFYWDIPKGQEVQASVFVLRISAATPCHAWRLWLHPASSQDQHTGKDAAAQHQQEEEEGKVVRQEEEGKTNAVVSHVQEITHAAAWLPEASHAARRFVRQWRLSDGVMKGINYNHTASWGMLLPTELLQNSNRITLWLGQPTNASAFHVTAQLIRHAHRKEGMAASQLSNMNPAHVSSEISAPNPNADLQDCRGLSLASDTAPTVQLSWAQLFKPKSIAHGYAAIHYVSINLSVDGTAKPWSETVCRDALKLPRLFHDTCIRFINGAMMTSAWAARASGILEHSGLVIHYHGCCNQQPSRIPFAGLLNKLRGATHHSCNTDQRCMHPTILMPCETGSTRKTACGDVLQVAASNLTVFDLAACLSSKNQSCRLALLTDPSCGYDLSLTLNPSHHLLGLLLAYLPSVWSYAQALLLLAIAIELTRAQSTPTREGAATGRINTAAVSNVLTQSWTQSAVIVALLAPLSYALSTSISQQLYQAQESATADAALGPGSTDMQAPTNWVAAHFETHEQLSIALWLSMLPCLLSCALGLATSHSPPIRRFNVSSMLLNVMAAVIGCIIPWCLASPRLMHPYIWVIKWLANRGLWLCSSVDCSTSHGPSLVEQLILLTVAAALLQALSVCLATLRIGMRFLFTILTWPAGFSMRYQSKQAEVAASMQEGKQGSRPVKPDKSVMTSMYSKYGLVIAIGSLLLLLALVLHVWLSYAVGLMLLIANQLTSGSNCQPGRNSAVCKLLIQTSLVQALALYCIISGPAGVTSLTSWRDHALRASSLADMLLAAPWLVLIAYISASVQQHNEVVQTNQRLQFRNGTLRLGCWLLCAFAFCSAVLGYDFVGHSIHTGTGTLILLFYLDTL